MSFDAKLLPVAALGLGLMVALGVLARQRPRLGLVLWLIAIGFVPVWMGITIRFYFAPATLLAILLLLFVAHRPGTLRFGLPDLLIAAFMASCLLPIFTGGSSLTTIFVAITGWFVPFLLGRLMPRVVGLDWLYGAIAVVFCFVAVGLLVEFSTGWNPFVTLMARGNGLYTDWGTIQTRGDISRAEWAFGHSIAAGSALALAMPLALASRFRPWLRIAMVLLMAAGVVVTISRVSMVCAAIAIALVIFMLKNVPGRARVGMLVTFVVLASSLIPFILTTLRSAGDEASNSASYRGWLLDLVPGISILGFSPLASRGTDGRLFFGNFQSIDSQLLYTGLLYGWFALILGVLCLLGAVLVVLLRAGSPATIAVVSQIPALATVALITQYADFFWFVAGVAVFSQVSAKKPEEEQPPASPTDSRFLSQAVRGNVGVRHGQHSDQVA